MAGSGVWRNAVWQAPSLPKSWIRSKNMSPDRLRMPGARASSSGPLKWTAASYMSMVAEGLPELCFSILKTTGQLICIKRGESGYYLSDWDTGDKERNVELADEMNENLGVSPVQRQAMEIGSLAGWDVPGADPKAYEQDALQMGGM